MRLPVWPFPFLICLTTSRALAGGGAAIGAYEGVRDDAVVDLHALADVYVEEDFNAPSSHATQLHAFDTHTNAPSLGILRLTAAHVPELFGFRIDLAAGDLADQYLHADPASTTNPDVSRTLSYLEQAFVTVKVPVGRGLAIDAGKFETPIGLEDNEATKNWSYSRSLLYLLAEPSFHSGVRVTYRPTETVGVSGYWINGWDANVLAGDGMRSFGAAVTWDPSEDVEAVVDYVGGLERAPTRLADPTLTMRDVVDGYVRVALGKHASFACTADYGHDAASGGVRFWGAGGYARYAFAEWLAASVRGEHYDDADGFTSGTKQRLAELTTTLEARDTVGVLGLMSRLEFRRDQSDVPFFQTSSPRLSLRQDTVSLSLLAAF